MTRKQHSRTGPAAPDYREPGYGLASPVVVAQMHGELLPHVERQMGDHWDMENVWPSANGAPE